jgi:hypothetical protein
MNKAAQGCLIRLVCPVSPLFRDAVDNWKQIDHRSRLARTFDHKRMKDASTTAQGEFVGRQTLRTPYTEMGDRRFPPPLPVPIHSLILSPGAMRRAVGRSYSGDEPSLVLPASRRTRSLPVI